MWRLRLIDSEKYRDLKGREAETDRPGQLSQTPEFPKATDTSRSFGIRRNEKTALHCTEGPGQMKSWKSSEGAEYELWKDNFPDAGNVRFGVQECTDLGINYDSSCFSSLLTPAGHIRLSSLNIGTCLLRY
ncbi:hypothetical protein A6R68_18400 [Neotoma lepida]|uniref:Uncharacterized protein n=1 Tax=Neotoma lepida TaxID=56216 RepID=A0A1A6HMK1_NEOLE|nr:hypothetical protein A6R68_18400 [Neotoma lepida]